MVATLNGPGNILYSNPQYLDQGGMGYVYLYDDNNNQKVAVKFIPIHHPDEENLLKSEFDIALSLNHPNIIRTHHYGKIIYNNLPYFYTVMEYCPNRDLSKLLRSLTDNLHLDESTSYMLEIATGLQEAHKLIVHRDIKPKNILLGDDGKLKICDFGIAKYVNELTRSKTFKGSGSYPYMSPECWRLEANTIRMDIYSLGIVFFEILTRSTPFIAHTETEFRDKHLYSLMPKLNSVRNDVPLKLSEIIMRMTEKEARKRYANMEEVITALQELEIVKNNLNPIVNTILQKIHEKVNRLDAAQLETQKQKEADTEKRKRIEYSILQLFERVKSIVDSINVSSERHKIVVIGGSQQLGLQFMSSQVTFEFFPFNAVEKYVGDIREMSRQHQLHRFGTLITTAFDKRPVEKERVVVVGKVTVSGKIYGFNLLLRNVDPDDVYGEWWICWFDDSALVPRDLQYHYPLDQHSFFKDFEALVSKTTYVRTMTYQILNDKHIMDVIEKMID